MKIRTLLSAAATVALACATVPAHAAPSTLFDDNVVVGNVSIQVNSDEFGTAHMNGWDGVQTQGSSVAHRNAELFFYDSELDSSAAAKCDSATADETEDGDDVILTCDETNLVDVYTDLSVKSEFRIFPADENGVVTLRVLYAVTNTSDEDVLVDELQSSLEFDEYYGDQRWSGNGELLGAAEFNAQTDVNWYALGGIDGVDGPRDVDMTTFGSAWQNDDAEVSFTIDGALDDEEFDLTADSVNFPAGETRYFAFFTVGAYIPSDATESEAEAIFADTFAAMEQFDGTFDGALAAGIPSGATVANWSSVEELADTGVETNSSLGLAVVLLAAGVAAVAVRRRQRA